MPQLAILLAGCCFFVNTDFSQLQLLILPVFFLTDSREPCCKFVCELNMQSIDTSLLFLFLLEYCVTGGDSNLRALYLFIAP